MITLLFSLDSLMHFIHVGGVGLSLGGVILLCLAYVLTLVKPGLARPLSSLTPIIFTQIWMGIATLGFSGLLLFLPRPWLAVEPLYIMKMILAAMVLATGIALNIYAEPRFRELAGDWEEKKPTVRKFQKVTAGIGILFFITLMSAGALSHLL